MVRAERAESRGFTLIELVIVLAVLAVIIGMLAPMAFQITASERTAALERELEEIYTAILGTPEKGRFGYVGDVGNYPSNLLDLVRPPVDTNNVPFPGWKGPYIQNARIENGVWLDPHGRPYEYYLVSGLGKPDNLAIVSRGPDGLSTNTSNTPADAVTYTGLSPADPNYPSDVNADNVSFPRVDANPAALNVKTDGDVALDVLNFDSNPQVKALVPACPQLYTITATSIARQTVEANMRYVPGLAFNLAQGQYRATLVPQVATAASWTGMITVVPGATLTRTLNVMGLDSSGTPLFNLTVTNGFTTTDVEVFEFDSRLSGMLPGQTSPSSSSVILRAGETRIYTPHGCAQIYIRKLGLPAVVGQFVMPYGTFTSQQGKQAATLLITNRVGHDHHDHGEGTLHHHQPDSRHHGHLRLSIYRNDVLLGTVNHHHKDMKFTDLLAGDKITIFDWDGNLLATLTLVVGTNSVTVGG